MIQDHVRDHFVFFFCLCMFMSVSVSVHVIGWLVKKSLELDTRPFRDQRRGIR